MRLNGREAGVQPIRVPVGNIQKGVVHGRILGFEVLRKDPARDNISGGQFSVRMEILSKGPAVGIPQYRPLPTQRLRQQKPRLVGNAQGGGMELDVLQILCLYPRSFRQRHAGSQCIKARRICRVFVNAAQSSAGQYGPPCGVFDVALSRGSIQCGHAYTEIVIAYNVRDQCVGLHGNEGMPGGGFGNVVRNDGSGVIGVMQNSRGRVRSLQTQTEFPIRCLVKRNVRKGLLGTAQQQFLDTIGALLGNLSHRIVGAQASSRSVDVLGQ
mmetsp:Transcript_20462/g.44513  ORF Transcript_20462/g.44513 Transcript_20462/m.44513 type:complete len:269 (-) Transcript_20462:542-1348(-)